MSDFSYGAWIHINQDENQNDKGHSSTKRSLCECKCRIYTVIQAPWSCEKAIPNWTRRAYKFWSPYHLSTRCSLICSNDHEEFCFPTWSTTKMRLQLDGEHTIKKKNCRYIPLTYEPETTQKSITTSWMSWDQCCTEQNLHVPWRRLSGDSKPRCGV